MSRTRRYGKGPKMSKRALWSTLALFGLLLASEPGSAAVISVGAFPDLNPAPPISIPADTFLVPVRITDAVKLQHWQFDLLFDNTVVEHVDPLDGSSGLYGAEFMPGDASSASFILGGFPFNVFGLVDDVAGSYPALPIGPSGDGILAYVLFRFLDGQEANDPNFAIADAIVQQAAVPEPAPLTLLMAGLVVVLVIAGRRSEQR